MRIISGRFKGHRFTLPSGKWKTRPTTDRAKESLFNILQNQYNLEGLSVLDLFAGTGNMGYEFASRGAAEVTFVDKYAGCVRYIRQNCEQLGISDECHIIKDDVFRFLNSQKQTYDIIFADPPYALKQLPQLVEFVFNNQLLAEQGCLVIEHDAKHQFEQTPHFVEARQYGQSYFSFFE